DITGGTVVVNGPSGSGNGALDVNGTLTVTGGTLLAAGSAGMVVAPDTSSAQASAVFSFDSTQPAGTIIHVLNSAGEQLVAFESSKDFQSVVFSSADVVEGEVYTVVVGGTVTGTTVGGLTATGDTSGATEATTATAGAEVTGGQGGFGGGRPGN
ncbi:MAG TPA: hypothetical protein VGP24_14460, partial [Glaciihabitans sp.]|nr:hypothetical protein [Glaciihabitans sp.]